MIRSLRLIRDLCLIAAACAVLVWLWRRHQVEASAQEPAEAAPAAGRVERLAGGGRVVSLTAQERANAGIESAAVEAASWRPEAEGYGLLEEDPALGFTIRAPAAGVLRAGPQGWPAQGSVLAAGVEPGRIEPRWIPTPLELADRSARLAEARGKVSEATAALEASQAAYARLELLWSRDQNGSQRALDEALARQRGDEARLRAAQEAVSLFEAPISGQAHAVEAVPPIPLRAERGGEVAEILAHDGESVEAGQPLLRLANYGRLIARVAFPLGAEPRLDAGARMSPLGHEDRFLAARPMSAAAASDPVTLGRSVLLAVDAGGERLIPGVPVRAWLPIAGAERSGVILPSAAIVRHQGRSFVFVEDPPGSFTLTGVELGALLKTGWFSPAPLAANQRVAVSGAQLLLSEILKARYQAGEDEGD